MTDLTRDLESLRLDDRPAPVRRRWPLVLLVLVALLGVLTTWRWFSRPPVVETVRVLVQQPSAGPGGAPVLTASGYVVARRKAVVSAKIQGRLATLLVEEGSRVRQGDVIATLESTDFDAQLARAKAQVNAVRAQVGTFDARIARADADVLEAQRQSSLADRLATEQVGSVDARDAARSRLSQARAALAEARAARQHVDAQLAQAQADVRVADAQLQNTRILAPFAGVVVRKMAEVGESVAPIPPGVNISTASGAIVALADMATLEAEFDIGESNVARLSDGQPAELVIEALPGRTFKAALRQVIPTADRTKATVLVKVSILDPDPSLKPEMSARVTFLERASASAEPTQPKTPTLRVPQSAIVTRDGKRVVFVVTDDGTVRMESVDTGLEQGGMVVVARGVRGQDVLVKQPGDGMRSGDRIRVAESR